MPEVPAVPGVAGLKACATLSDLVQAVFAHDGPLARAIPDFEARAGQTEMAAAVARRFEEGGVLLAEALLRSGDLAEGRRELERFVAEAPKHLEAERRIAARYLQER